jgi:hypothetical protein
MRKVMAVLCAVGALGIAAVPAVAQLGEGPGNGGGQSGQCTGPQDERPANCNSKGGPGDQGGN